MKRTEQGNLQGGQEQVHLVSNTRFLCIDLMMLIFLSVCSYVYIWSRCFLFNGFCSQMFWLETHPWVATSRFGAAINDLELFISFCLSLGCFVGGILRTGIQSSPSTFLKVHILQITFMFCDFILLFNICVLIIAAGSNQALGLIVVGAIGEQTQNSLSFHKEFLSQLLGL